MVKGGTSIAPANSCPVTSWVPIWDEGPENIHFLSIPQKRGGGHSLLCHCRGKWKETFRQFISLINRDVNEAPNVPSTGKGIGDTVTKGHISALEEPRGHLGRQGEHNVRDI